MQALQTQEEELHRLAPMLAPSTCPRSAASRDLLALSEKEGERGAEALLHVLAAAADGVGECGICGEAGEVVLDPDAEPGEALPLRFTLLIRLRFVDRSLLASRALFACGLCRSLRQTSSLLAKMASVADEEGKDTVEGLLEHLAEVNGHASLAESPEACYTWAQQLLSRAYALQIAASNVSGWRLCHPNGEPIEGGALGAAARLALELLLPEASSEERSAALASALEQIDDERDAEVQIPRTAPKIESAGKSKVKKSRKRSSESGGAVLAGSDSKRPVLVNDSSRVRTRKQKSKVVRN